MEYQYRNRTKEDDRPIRLEKFQELFSKKIQEPGRRGYSMTNESMLPTNANQTPKKSEYLQQKDRISNIIQSGN
jgi:hypothetical protein